MSYYKRFLKQKSIEDDTTRFTKKLIYNIIDNKFIQEIYINKNGYIYIIDEIPKEFFNSLKLNKTVQRLILSNISCKNLNPLINMFKFNHSINTLKLNVCNFSNIDTVITLLTNNTSILYLFLVFDKYNISNEIYDENSEYYNQESLLVDTFINKINLLFDILKTNNILKVLYIYNLSINIFKNKINEINKKIDIKFLNS